MLYYIQYCLLELDSDMINDCEQKKMTNSVDSLLDNVKFI